MSKLAIFIAQGCEEIEALTVVDVCRRAGVEIDMISITGVNKVTSSHGVTFHTERLIEEVNMDDYEGVILPGGMPGTLNLGAHKRVVATAKAFAQSGKLVAAICAAPSVLGENGILEGKNAVCYPGFEDKLLGAKTSLEPVVVDGNIITSRGMGTAIEFGLAIVAYVKDEESSKKVRDGIIYRAW